MGISDEEWGRLQKAIGWPIPDQEITHLNQSTSPGHSTFSIVGLKESYKVREKISVIITATTTSKNLKRYGGDFFKAKLFNADLNDEEWGRLQKAIDWPIPDQEITHLNQSTSPGHSTFSIVGLKETQYYILCLRLKALKMYLPTDISFLHYTCSFPFFLKASVYGEVVDHRNGTYSVALLLHWEGQAQVSVRLEHSSEVVQILKKYRESSFPRSHYNGYFEGPGLNKTKIHEVVECNLKWGADGSWRKGDCCCEYKDIKTGTVWQCERPKELSCDKLVHHSYGRLESPLHLFEQQLFTKKVTYQMICNNRQSTMEKCRSGMTTPVPAGFYLNDVWKSFVCNTRQFSPAQMGNCLKNKIVYLMGDSTTRQWFEYLERNVPGKCIKRMDLHTPPAGGPLMAVELKYNIIIHWRPHGVPLRFSKMPITDLHYINNDIDEIAGGPHAVVVFTLFAHLVFHPITFYVYEVAKIRQSVVALLSRAPETTVIINLCHNNTLSNANMKHYLLGMKDLLHIDGVIFLDVWQMTSCHYLREHIHPRPVIIANEVNMFLSYVSPSCGLFNWILFHRENGKLTWSREG
uniref:NXPE C-terminal domain-containing protein n=1 Tax=Sinocyclocheilus rhinocerous TaxID=307959 RepID=A0A673FS37_9TELE